MIPRVRPRSSSKDTKEEREREKDKEVRLPPDYRSLDHTLAHPAN